MILPADVARCAGQTIHPEGAHWEVTQPQCQSCKRYHAGREVVPAEAGVYRVVWMGTPEGEPCEERIPQ